MPDAQAGQNESGSESKQTDWSGVIGGLGFWALVGIFVIIGYRSGTQADVFLDVPNERPLVLKGFVARDSEPVENAFVRIVIEDASTDKFLAAVVLQTDAKGRFSTAGQTLVAEPDAERRMRITARIAGKAKDKDFTGESVTYLNYVPPFLGKQTWWVVLAASLALMALLIVLFTGELGRRKARVLFGVMYLMTFMSLAIPLWVAIFLFNNHTLADFLRDAPVGLVKASAAGFSDPQWVINVGGTVVRAKAPEAPKPAGALITEAKAGLPVVKVAGAEAAHSATPVAGADAVPAETMLISGGLAIPFYVILLAMLGAGINLTRKVPEIQQRYDQRVLPQERWLSGNIVRFLTFGQKQVEPTDAPPPEEAKAARGEAAGIRRELVENYMYLLSAPFLAIAVFYLLRILTTGEVAQPILVVMAFATGLTCDTVIKAIIDFAKNKIGDDEDKGDKPAPAG